MGGNWQEVDEGGTKNEKEAAVREEVAPGLLSKAFSRQRTVSLHNLLDRPVLSYLPREAPLQVNTPHPVALPCSTSQCP